MAKSIQSRHFCDQILRMLPVNVIAEKESTGTVVLSTLPALQAPVSKFDPAQRAEWIH